VQLYQIQSVQVQEQQATTLATQLAQQRAALRQSGKQVEEPTDTRKKLAAGEMMKKLASLAAQRAGGSGGGNSEMPGPLPSGGGEARDLRVERRSGGRREREHTEMARGSGRREREHSEMARGYGASGRREQWVRDRDRDREREREWTRERGERAREHERERERARDKERDWRRERESGYRDRDRRRQRDKDRDADSGKEGDRGGDYDRQRDRERGKVRGAERERVGKDRETERPRKSNRDGQNKGQDSLKKERDRDSERTGTRGSDAERSRRRESDLDSKNDRSRDAGKPRKRHAEDEQKLERQEVRLGGRASDRGVERLADGREQIASESKGRRVKGRLASSSPDSDGVQVAHRGGNERRGAETEGRERNVRSDGCASKDVDKDVSRHDKGDQATKGERSRRHAEQEEPDGKETDRVLPKDRDDVMETGDGAADSGSSPAGHGRSTKDIKGEHGTQHSEKKGRHDVGNVSDFPDKEVRENGGHTLLRHGKDCHDASKEGLDERPSQMRGKARREEFDEVLEQEKERRGDQTLNRQPPKGHHDGNERQREGQRNRESHQVYDSRERDSGVTGRTHDHEEVHNEKEKKGGERRSRSRREQHEDDKGTAQKGENQTEHEGEQELRREHAETFRDKGLDSEEKHTGRRNTDSAKRRDDSSSAGKYARHLRQDDGLARSEVSRRHEDRGHERDERKVGTRKGHEKNVMEAVRAGEGGSVGAAERGQHEQQESGESDREREIQWEHDEQAVDAMDGDHFEKRQKGGDCGQKKSRHKEYEQGGGKHLTDCAEDAENSEGRPTRPLRSEVEPQGRGGTVRSGGQCTDDAGVGEVGHRRHRSDERKEGRQVEARVDGRGKGESSKGERRGDRVTRRPDKKAQEGTLQEQKRRSHRTTGDRESRKDSRQEDYRSQKQGGRLRADEEADGGGRHGHGNRRHSGASDHNEQVPSPSVTPATGKRKRTDQEDHVGELEGSLSPEQFL
jgi:hypothetical protein